MYTWRGRVVALAPQTPRCDSHSDVTNLCLPPERHLPTPGQRGQGPQRHTAADTAAPTTADMGNTVPHMCAT